ncbi:P-loop containing nucleoside triphosphate hydrolase protein [Schizopora paradoxa]|uniref:DNA 3'-5' helicase n=1 Tax=Schizopora paradoxa TaxID=27342 RepID=A0A0H2R0Y0_9AGAM|nr:P-loop containing nucleoside triphosphate hydrolase protein [Schizopora paradoxa]
MQPHIVHLPLSTLGHENLSKLQEDASFLDTLSIEELVLVGAASVVLDKISQGKKAPRGFQLKAMLSAVAGRDCIVRAATGSGKTLAMMLAHLLFPEDVVITVSPLKLLQTAQVEEFNSYGIRSIAVNEDTVLTSRVIQDIRSGAIKHIVTSPEQLTVVRGQIPFLARLMHERTFTKRIKRVNVDEAHFIIKAGLAKGTDPPFRVAYSKIGDLRVHIGRDVSFVAVSATLPADVVQAIKENLHMKDNNTDTIMLSSNRPNLIYGVMKMVGSLKNFNNIKFLVPSRLSSVSTLQDLRKGVLFIENKILTSQAADYLNDLLPPHLRKLQPFRHIHSSMSPQYNSLVYGDFAKPDGHTRCIVATSTAAHGVDVNSLTFVVSFGLTESILELEQKLGRAGRDGKTPSFALTIAEPWAYDNTVEGPISMSSAAWKKSRSKQLRTEFPVRQYARTDGCKRKFLQQYNNDTSSSALDSINDICCDSPEHQTDFNAALQDFFKIDALTGASTLPKDTKSSESIPQKRRGGRLKVQRPELEKRIKAWRQKIHDEDEDYTGFPIGYILPSMNLDDLVAARPKTFKNASELKMYINKPESWDNNWAQELYNIVIRYDAELTFTTLMDGSGTASNSNSDATSGETGNSSTTNGSIPIDNSQQVQEEISTVTSSSQAVSATSNFTQDQIDKARAYVTQLMSESLATKDNQENINRSPPDSPRPIRSSKRRRTALNNKTNTA